jgi:hypothetical protein
MAEQLYGDGPDLRKRRHGVRQLWATGQCESGSVFVPEQLDHAGQSGHKLVGCRFRLGAG